MAKLAGILAVLAGALWGAVGLFVRYQQGFGFDTFTVLEMRVIISAVMLALFLFFFHRDMFRIRLKDAWLFLTSGLLGMTVLNLAYNLSIETLSVSFSAVLLSLAPLYVVFAAAILFKEKITAKKVLCMFAAVGGCVLVSGLAATGVANASWTGIGFGLLAGLCYGLYSIVSRLANERGYHAFTITFYGILLTAIVTAPFADWGLMGQFIQMNPVGHSAFCLLNSALTSVAPYVLFSFALSHGDTGVVSILAAAGEPTAAMVFGALFLSEVPTVLNMLGLVVIIAVLVVLNLPDKRPAEYSAT